MCQWINHIFSRNIVNCILYSIARKSVSSPQQIIFFCGKIWQVAQQILQALSGFSLHLLAILIQGGCFRSFESLTY